ncbi:AraC family transcriptional regulator [Pseudomonas syringae pv. tomato]|uniref:Helix-turn-helix domain-containing protein n=2 Tax=Pseudomonas syringae group TaxID=136849 RepID=A0AAW4E7G9_PSESX|nr:MULTISPECIES: helix-turn-helix domain-containing protein [Pseudomonas syringae group]AVI84733.1 AraC family transcriptional regulator [Pseudomonas syringae pv. tomato]EEB58385.1 transcriptional regulator, AraC family [Pseudomonas syringae pv. tomato T1]KGK93556.1 AraC family transcriptional regulator [Pseudomonas syringae pv. tomato]KPB77595.1 Transcriptional regulator [Pseudomonas syringae pv. maculicola]KUR41098.1 HTH-type transcriptional regulator CdhR [Pseudomonas syringae pv. tomato]
MTYVFESVLQDQNMRYSSSGKKAVNPRAVIRVAFILMDNFSLMSFTAAMDALVTANLMGDAPIFDIVKIGLKGRVAMSDLGIAIPTDLDLSELRARHDLLLVVGGLRVDLKGTPCLRRKLFAAASAGTSLGGLWNGAYFLADARVMGGHTCAVHPDGRAMMADAFPDLRISDRSHVVDLERVTCAGASSSLRMMLEYIRVTKGSSLARAVEEILGCDEHEQVCGVSTVAVDSDPTLPQALKVALELMQKNIEEPLSLDDLAACAGISKRQLERRFFRFIGAAPARYYLELRLTRARQLVLQTNRSITDIAMATGFISMPHFHRRFRDFFDAAPGSYRATYEVRK